MSTYTSATDADRKAMLDAIGVGSLDDLFSEIPEAVRLDRPLDIPAGMSETEVFDHLNALAARNVSADDETSFLGAGMYDHYVPSIIDSILRGRSSLRRTRRTSRRSARAACRSCSSSRPRSRS